MIRLEGEPRTEEFTFTLGQLEKVCDLISAVNREQTHWVRRNSAWWDMISPISHSFCIHLCKTIYCNRICMPYSFVDHPVCLFICLSVYLLIYLSRIWLSQLFLHLHICCFTEEKSPGLSVLSGMYHIPGFNPSTVINKSVSKINYTAISNKFSWSTITIIACIFRLLLNYIWYVHSILPQALLRCYLNMTHCW